MSTKKITSLCNMQLNDMAKWKISYANAEGSGAKKVTYSIRSTALYVCEPNYSSVEKIKKKITKCKEETLDDISSESKDSSDESAQATLQP